MTAGGGGGVQTEVNILHPKNTPTSEFVYPTKFSTFFSIDRYFIKS